MSSAKKPKAKSTKKILVIEDEGTIGLTLNLILAERELEMDYVNSLLDADEYLKKNKPTLIMLDNKLPDGFGVDFIRYIRKNYPHIKIIMISGFGSARDVAITNGVDAFIEKPFSMDEINEALDKLLT